MGRDTYVNQTHPATQASTFDLAGENVVQVLLQHVGVREADSRVGRIIHLRGVIPHGYSRGLSNTKARAQL